MTERPSRSTRNKRWRVLLIVIAALLIVRIILPYVLLHFANDRLKKVKGYYGHIADLDLAIIRGAYKLEGFYLDRKDTVTEERTPFLSAGVIDLSVEWRALFHGSIVGELVVDTAEVRFTKEVAEPAELQKDTASFADLLHDFMPLKINRLEFHNSAVRYIDPTSSPKVDVQLSQVDLLATNLSNAMDSTVVLPSKVVASAGLYGGQLTFNMGIDPLAPSPTFDMNLKLTETDLTELNEMLQAYGNVDVNQGTMSLYTEIATRNGEFTGYVKPVIKDLDVLGPEDKNDSFFHKVYEGIVGTVGSILTNPRKEQVATKVELKGKLDDVKTSSIYAVIQLLRNAFIQALVPALDQEVSINSVGEIEKKDDRGFFEKLFNSDDKGRTEAEADTKKGEE
ncbi:MAG: DUF748 domain-containing protein [Flavobacteriales bacterium]|nr:DUF748 domain-containing protein [Flavobacteriales bacterium]